MLNAGCGATGASLASKDSSGGSDQSSGPAALTITTASLPGGTAGAAYSGQVAASGGTSPYAWSVSSGQLPGGIALNATTGALSGTPKIAGTYGATLKVTDSSRPSQSVTATFMITVAAASGSGNSGSGSGGSGSGSGGTGSSGTPSAMYGPGLNADALSNVRIGPYGLQASYRFLAEHTGTVSQMRVYLIVLTPKPGYEGGNGGKILVQLQTDDGTDAHNPSGTTLASYEITSPQAGPSDTAAFPTIVFSPAPKLQAGTLYHLVFTNVDADPSVNYVSVDNLWTEHPTSPMQPMYTDQNFAVLQRYTGSSWALMNDLTPIMQVSFTDGASFGCGYMEVWSQVPEPIGGASAVRETLTVSGGNKIVNQVSLRVARISGSGDLTMKLEESDGTVMDTETIPATQLPQSQSSTVATYEWVTFKFAELQTLVSGQGYNVEFDAPAGTTYQAFPIRKGISLGFQTGTYFPDGYAEFNSGSGWAGWTQWGVTNRNDDDLQFYFNGGN